LPSPLPLVPTPKQSCFILISEYLINRNLLFTILEAGKSCCLLPNGAFSLCPHMEEGINSGSSRGRRQKGANRLFQILFIRLLIPFMKAAPSCPNHFLKAPFLILLHWGLSSNMHFGGTKHSNPIAVDVTGVWSMDTQTTELKLDY
jgi:hypothetical protein